jgi:hypothetical protein
MNKKTFWQRVKEDEAKLARYSRAIIAWIGGLAIQIAAVGADVVQNWTIKRWFWGLLIAALPGIVGLISVGEKNPKTAP